MNYKSLFLGCLLIFMLSGCTRESYNPTPAKTPPIVAGSNDSPQLTPSPDVTPDQLETTISDFEHWQNTLTPQNPSQDKEVIKTILQTLLDRFVAQFDKAGWYKFDERMGTYEDLNRKVTWVHINDPVTLNFDQYFQYYDVPGVYAPGVVAIGGILTIEAKQGVGAITETLDDYRFRQPEFPFREPPVTNLINPDFYLDEHIDEMQFGDDRLSLLLFLQDNPLETEPNGNSQEHLFAVWFEQLDGQQVLVLKEKVKHGGTLPRTVSGERLQSEDRVLYFNLENGGQIMLSYTWYYLSGNTDSYSEPKALDNITWFADLPPDEQARYDEATRRLEEFINP